jgi:hypothetical protein
MGDEAAVDVLKVLSAKPSLTPAELESVLDIIHMAFEPAAISEPVNQKPLAAVFLLEYRNSTTTDATIRQRITEETTFVQAASVPSSTNPSTPK